MKLNSRARRNLAVALPTIMLVSNVFSYFVLREQTPISMIVSLCLFADMILVATVMIALRLSLRANLKLFNVLVCLLAATSLLSLLLRFL